MWESWPTLPPQPPSAFWLAANIAISSAFFASGSATWSSSFTFNTSKLVRHQ
jgi:hypothetical protein